ncbi:hypothetical protein [Streptomyces shenzhenensis]|uniref:hypothetical protein n=1 Tax=Streptomyces shenzhenensis TaxID=943815 RepID=UPI0011C408E2|nr:hypothetical protein [Streptomyces shenzhenensis]
MTSPSSPDALVRSVAESIANRTAGQKQPVRALESVVGLVEADEADMAVDHLARVIDYYRIPILQTEYDQLVSAATQLDALDSITETRIDRLITG